MVVYLLWFIDHDGFFIFGFYQNGVRLKKIINLGKSCLIFYRCRLN